MKFALSKTVLTDWEEKIPAGLYRGLFVRFSGTNNTGYTLSAADIGNFKLTLNGEQIMFISSDFLADLNNQWFGYQEASSTSGGSFAFSFIVPFYRPGFPSGLHVKPDDELYLALQVGGNVSSYVANWKIEVDTLPTNEPEKYILRILQANETVGGAVTYKKRIPNENVFELFLKGSNVSKVQIERDGELVYSSSYNNLIAESSLRNRVESSTVNYADLVLGDQVSDMLSDQVDVEFTTTASDTVYIQYISFAFDNERKRQSFNLRQNEVEKRIAPIKAKRPREIEVVRSPELEQKLVLL